MCILKDKATSANIENVVILILTHNLETFLLLDRLKHGFSILHFAKNSAFFYIHHI